MVQHAQTHYDALQRRRRHTLWPGQSLGAMVAAMFVVQNDYGWFRTSGSSRSRGSGAEFDHGQAGFMFTNMQAYGEHTLKAQFEAPGTFARCAMVCFEAIDRYHRCDDPRALWVLQTVLRPSDHERLLSELALFQN